MNYFYVGVYIDDKLIIGNHEQIGLWHDYFVLRVEDHVATRMEFSRIKAVPLEEKIAYAWKFAGLSRPYLNIKDDALEYYNIGKDKLIDYKPGKSQYVLTDEDWENGVIFAKKILRAKMHRMFENINNFTKKEIYSELYEDYLLYVYQTKDASYISSTEKELNLIVKSREKYYNKLRILVNKMNEEEKYIELIKTNDDVNDATYKYHYLFTNFAVEFFNDEKTNDDQKTNTVHP